MRLEYDNHKTSFWPLLKENIFTAKRIEKVDLLIAEVPSFVVLHITLCPKALSTVLGTCKGARIGVNSHVNFQVLLLTERRKTVRKLAFEGVCAEM